MNPIYFASPTEWRAWLTRHHATGNELWVGFYKKATGMPSLTWPESVDQALCFGWIDGIRKTIDQDRYVIRFTRRRVRSDWSLANIKRVGELTELGLMRAAGRKAFEERKRAASYSYEQRKAPTFSPALQRRFRTHPAAWKFFQEQPPGYRRLATFYVVSAKQETTRIKRLERLIADSGAARRLAALDVRKK
jgi:uncharacterized protein YdeI (YjbR/CyaY-like superfamily)